jgi:hypothetical protein
VSQYIRPCHVKTRHNKDTVLNRCQWVDSGSYTVAGDTDRLCRQSVHNLYHNWHTRCTTDHITPATTFIWCVHCPHLYIIQMHSHSEVTICRRQWLCLSTNCLPHFVNCPLRMYNPVVAVVVWSVVVWSVVPFVGECLTAMLRLQTTGGNNKMMAQW